MKFPHHVRHNGIDYPIGTDVPIEVETPAVKAGASVSGKAKKEVKEVKEEKGRKYSEEELDVPYFSLKALAKKEGLKIPDKAKAGEIKDMLRAL